ncbi:MAG: hypothetical protein DVB27_11915 [Verrucomicrobia bacterium]|jgi:hypothetical protein|nr:MAG: hypothetical protein DVB27_11915 [Verrucomicrobiota bacterium]
MRAVIFALLIPGLIIGVLRAEWTSWRLLTGNEQAALQEKIAALEQEVAGARKLAAEAKKVVQAHQEKDATGAWVREGNYRSPLDKGPPAGPGKTK